MKADQDRQSLESTDQAKPDNNSLLKATLSPFKKSLYVALAFFFFVLGTIGLFLPLIPTTPFYLLMSFFLIRVSPALHQRVLKLPMVGKPLRDWEEKGGVRFRVKVLAYLMVSSVVIYGVFFSPMNVYLKITLVTLAAIGIYVVYRLPTLDESASKKEIRKR